MKSDTDLHSESWNTRNSIGSDDVPPPPKKYVRAKLTNSREVSRELAKLYREARSGSVDVADASRLANVLSILSRLIETSSLEKRIEELESRGPQ